MRRAVQFGSWIAVAPVLGGLLATASFLLPMLQRGDLANPDLRTLLAGLALVYGGAWLLPALLLADLVFLRRALATRDYIRYLFGLTIAACGIGCVLPGMLVMVGYPATAAAILGFGFWYRRPARG